MDTKNSLAQHVFNQKQKVKDSIPNNTFKSKTLPYTVISTNFNEVAEPTSQPHEMLSPLEYMGLLNNWHRMPASVQKVARSTKATRSADLDSAMVMKGKWKTSNAGKTKPVRFTPYTKTSTNIHTLRGARSNRSSNQSILSAGPEDQYAISDFRARRFQKHAILNAATLGAAKRVLVRLGSGGIEPTTAMADPDVQLLLSSALDWSNPSLINQIVLQTGISRDTYSTAISSFMPIMRGLQAVGRAGGAAYGKFDDYTAGRTAGFGSTASNLYNRFDQWTGAAP